MTSNSALERKRKSEAILLEEGVPFASHLPVVENEETAQIRDHKEVAWRAMALNIVACKGEGLEQSRVLALIDQYKLTDVLTPNELHFILSDAPSEHERKQFVWRYEAYWVLLWALHYVEELGRPDQICDVPRAVGIMVERTAAEFIRDARLRTAGEILDVVDLIYRYDWACVDARLNGKAVPGGLDSDVVVERHQALNWLVGYGDNADWDHVSTDT
ncbi:MAG: DUF4272 domain-containing protein [Pyrinomonadaceae bacterium]